MNGALPPSSRESFFSVGEHCCIRMRPTAVEPVNESLRTTGESHRALPTTMLWSASAVTTLMTPGGNPARSANSARARAESGVCSAGLTTTVQPAASAGAILRVIIPLGKFQGVIAAQTPIGSRNASSLRSGHGEGIVSPYTRRASSANHSTKLMP